MFTKKQKDELLKDSNFWPMVSQMLILSRHYKVKVWKDGKVCFTPIKKN